MNIYNAPGHKLRFPQNKKAQFVTVKGIETLKKFGGVGVVAKTYTIPIPISALRQQ